jgi:hypothetical protein
VNDKNAEKRYEYDLKISDVERNVEELHIQENQFRQSLENFNRDITQSFHTLMTIEDDLNRRNYGTSGFSETEQKRRYLVQVIENQVEEQDLQFRKASQKLEDERETLLKERNNLSWD